MFWNPDVNLLVLLKVGGVCLVCILLSMDGTVEPLLSCQIKRISRMLYCTYSPPLSTPLSGNVMNIYTVLLFFILNFIFGGGQMYQWFPTSGGVDQYQSLGNIGSLAESIHYILSF